MGQKTVLPLLREAGKACKAEGRRGGTGHISKLGDDCVNAVLHLMILAKCFVRLTVVMEPPAILSS